MKNNRFAVLAATAVIAMGALLTGCGDDSATPSDTNNTETTTPADTNTSTDTAKQDDTTKTEDTAATGDEQVINVTAQNFKWTLDKTEVKVGQPVKMVVTGKEGFHGLTIPGTDVNGVQIKAGETTEVTFTPEKAGDLMIMCSIMCGAGHGDMHTTLKVVE
ncbi:MAG TPA: hypothetical protein VFV52_06870 [Bacilli bacterium]|nr:hypothetical protein [Bacilli bacterium]